ncbi:SDR family NAD(P)-dependent oxidoreductase [Aliagarivorans taiwanensis]|uniref:SDR family NAD(P)-dependent oxidoreductase n=1 Tax=Aliagarivorans taiwanensis TaxID=561966 RepID=UPI00042652CC|nr:SDR family oxidoreductase [Aliagarivorans taiwanensis]
MANSNLALVTGASGGIGLELARQHAQRGGDLVLVARNEAKLEQLQQELEAQHKVKVTVLAQNLTQPNAAESIANQLKQLNLEVGTLINNAGFGGHGLFHQRNWQEDRNMMQVNMVALSELTHLLLPGMIAHRSGRILNVSSTASFMPGPLQATYYATKAFVTSFSQALAEEVAELGVTVTALCPGAVKTGFVEAGNLDGVAVWDKAKSAESVAKCGYQAMENGQLVAFNENCLKFMLNWVIPFLPRKTVLKMSRQFMEKA